MPVSFVNAGALGSSATVTPITLTAPACSAGDILVAFLINKELTVAISAPDGTWTQIGQANGDCTTAADDHRWAIFWKTATGSGGDFSFSKAADNNVLFMGAIAVWTGQNAAAPIDATAVGITTTAAAGDNVSFPAFDPTSNDVEVVFAAFYGNDATTFNAAMSADTNPDCTIRFDLESSLGNDASIAVCSGTNNGANVAARTWASASGTDAGSTGVVFAIVASTPAIVPIAMRQYRERWS